MIRPCCALFLACFFSLPVCGEAGQVNTDQPAVLKLPIFPVPIVAEKVPLTKALSEIGVHLRDGYVLFGIEMRLTNGKEPTVDLNVTPGSTLGDALRQVFRRLPDYRFEVLSVHLINVYPAGAKDDPDDLLNFRVAGFDIVGEQADSIIQGPDDYIPDFKARLTARTKGPPPPIEAPFSTLRSVGYDVTLHLRSVTVRQVLNAVTEATEKLPTQHLPLGWVASFRLDPSLRAGRAYSWSVHGSVPHNWKEEVEKSHD